MPVIASRPRSSATPFGSLDEVVFKVASVTHWLWRVVDQTGLVLDVPVQSWRNKQAGERLLRKLLKTQMRSPCVMITDKLAT